MKRLLSVAILNLLLLLSTVSVSANQIVNGDFSSGLSGWKTNGVVSVNPSNEATVAENETYFYSALYQAVALSQGSYEIEFDFLNNLSSDTLAGDDNSFPDVFFASVYFGNHPNDFENDLTSDSLALFDMDHSGPFNINGTIGDSQKVGDWSHFSATFQNDYAYAIPVFELSDFNFIAEDSSVLIDNVQINAAPVPEPTTLVLSGLGLLLGGASILRIRRKQTRGGPMP